jgi:MFS family permease
MKSATRSIGPRREGALFDRRDGQTIPEPGIIVVDEIGYCGEALDVPGSVIVTGELITGDEREGAEMKPAQPSTAEGDCTADEQHSTTQSLRPIGSETSAIASGPPTARDSRTVIALLPIMAVVFVAHLVIGVAMPVLPLHVHQGLGLSTFVVGIVAGSQFAAALVTRLWAGHFVDTRGARSGIVTGLLIAAGAGLLYLLSLRFAGEPGWSVTILLLGRALLGGAASLIITGSLNWGLALMGPQNTGKVMAWVGTALYAAIAVGAPAGGTLYAARGFQAIALAAMLIPLGALPLVAFCCPVTPSPRHERAAFTSVVGSVWVPGLALALSGVGFAAVTTFVVLLFAQHGWGPAWLAFTALSLAFVVGRLIFGHLPDLIGGAKVALVCVLIEAVAQALICLAPSFAVALVGVTLTGLGYSLVYPGFGVEAIRRVPPERRGLALGAYTAFLDLSFGVSSPALGLVADRAGLRAVFLASTMVVLCSAAIGIRILSTSLSNDRKRGEHHEQ